MIKVFEEGFVRLDDAMADDLSVVNAARVSFGVRRETLEDADRHLISFLMRERHGTPFEHNSFRFHVRCPIFVAREWFRHRIGSFNELSGRYSELETVGYIPELSSIRTQLGKPGAYTFEPTRPEIAEDAVEAIQFAYMTAFAEYKRMLSMGVAKEVARIVLPVGIYTEFYWTVNARSLMNFLSLRLDETAQYEIREYANAVSDHFADKMPITHLAWENNGRVSP